MKQLNIKDLLLLGINSVIKKKKKCSYGDLIKEVFSKYPSLFSIADYPKWPDSLKLDRPLRELRGEGLITGSPTTFYSLTSLGREKLRLLSDRHSLIIQKTKKPTRSPSLSILNELEKSEEFRVFLSDRENFKPNNMKIRALMRFTLETPRKIVLAHLDFLKRTAHKEMKVDLENFLITYINYIKEIN